MDGVKILCSGFEKAEKVRIIACPLATVSFVNVLVFISTFFPCRLRLEN
jgi:hypothetical protein